MARPLDDWCDGLDGLDGLGGLVELWVSGSPDQVPVRSLPGSGLLAPGKVRQTPGPG